MTEKPKNEPVSNVDRHPTNAERRAVIAGTSALALVTAARVLAQGENVPDPALGMWRAVNPFYDQRDYPESDSWLQNRAEIEALEEKYRREKEEGTLSETDTRAYATELRRLSFNSARLLKQYEENVKDGEPKTYPGAQTTQLIENFEASVQEIEDEDPPSPKQPERKERLLEEYIRDAILLNMFDLDERMTNAKVRGYYCGYFGISCEAGF